MYTKSLYLISVLIALVFSGCLERQRVSRMKIESASIQSKEYIYDYFSQSIDSCVYYVGNIRLMPSDCVDFQGLNQYSELLKEDAFNIYFKKELLFSYSIKDSKILDGRVYYPFDEKIAIWGQFHNFKLHGLLILFDRNGEVLEIMEYKKGKYKYHRYHWMYLKTSGKKIRLSSPFDYQIITT